LSESVALSFLRDLKGSCLSKKGIRNLEFWEGVKGIGRSLSLISNKEARKQGGQSDVSEEEAVDVSYPYHDCTSIWLMHTRLIVRAMISMPPLCCICIASYFS
jgi:hypothetical protein